MKKLVFSIAFLFIVTGLFAQQQPLYSQYLLNGFLLNPAMAGSESYIPIRITARDQWEGIKGAPRTLAVSGHTQLAGQKMGVGGYIYTDAFGPISRTGLMASYAYHLMLHKIDSKLAFGLSVSAFQYKVDQSNLILKDDIGMDNALSGGVETSFAPDACFGAYLYRPNYFVGIAATQLIEYDLGLNDNNVNSMVRHYYFSGGYKFKLNDKFDIEPSLLVKTTEETPAQVDINVKTYFMENYWLAISYRTSKAMVAVLGIKYDMFYLGYAFDWTFGKISEYSTGSHEIVLGVNLGENKVKGSSLL
ncbi:MAG: hypothetical protein C0594_02665 [Marinilabiliales bacterium]|nr:MAG: hypothetical protein C0594_02665 [Marinilabiliales bacterium]